jgi:ferredoxin
MDTNMQGRLMPSRQEVMAAWTIRPGLGRQGQSRLTLLVLCISVCPVDCIIPDPKHEESKVQLQAKFEAISAAK